MWLEQLAVSSGLDQYTFVAKAPSAETTATAINNSSSSSSATLRPLIEGWTYIHKKLFYTTTYMIQGRIIDDQDCYDRYSEMIGKEYMATLKAAIEKEPLMF